MDFVETITTRAALREVLAEPNEFVTSKEVTELDEPAETSSPALRSS
jgi:hypothetical protein